MNDVVVITRPRTTIKCRHQHEQHAARHSLMGMRALLACFLGAAKFNEPIRFIIGDRLPAGAVKIPGESSHVALDSACGDGHCPSMILFTGSQSGTISVTRCNIGQKYTFINKSTQDTGVVVQQHGGLWGAKMIPQYDMGDCFCAESEAADKAMVVEPDGSMSPSSSGVLLCR